MDVFLSINYILWEEKRMLIPVTFNDCSTSILPSIATREDNVQVAVLDVKNTNDFNLNDTAQPLRVLMLLEMLQYLTGCIVTRNVKFCSRIYSKYEVNVYLVANWLGQNVYSFCVNKSILDCWLKYDSLDLAMFLYNYPPYHYVFKIIPITYIFIYIYEVMK